MKRALRAGASAALMIGAGAVGGMGLAAIGATEAGAAPSNAPDSVMGTFNCGSAGSGTFVINSGNSHAAQTWNVAHLTFDSGASGVFVPNMINLTGSFNGQPITQQASKNGPAGSALCTIHISEGPVTLDGQVGGMIVMTG